jgi:hypothetical protein
MYDSLYNLTSSFFVVLQALIELDLSSNKITNHGAENIAFGLQQNRVTYAQ